MHETTTNQNPWLVLACQTVDDTEKSGSMRSVRQSPRAALLAVPPHPVPTPLPGVSRAAVLAPLPVHGQTSQESARGAWHRGDDVEDLPSLRWLIVHWHPRCGRCVPRVCAGPVCTLSLSLCSPLPSPGALLSGAGRASGVVRAVARSSSTASPTSPAPFTCGAADRRCHAARRGAALCGAVRRGAMRRGLPGWVGGWVCSLCWARARQVAVG